MLRVPGVPRKRDRQVSRSASLLRPQVVAHRGSSAIRPEHTLGAYTEALSQGAEALECDVRLTADGHLVCVHDRRVDRTSNGQGIVSALELADLESLDWASWKEPWRDLDDEAAELDTDLVRILTLERLLRAIYDWGSPVDLAVETKHPTRYASLVERRLVETLDRFGWLRPRRGSRGQARVMSFSWLSLRRCEELAPQLERVYLMDKVPVLLRDGSLPPSATAAGPSIDVVLAHPEYVRKAHAAGHPVHVWTVNNPVDVELCASLGVDAVITDRPGETLRQLQRRRRPVGDAAGE